MKIPINDQIRPILEGHARRLSEEFLNSLSDIATAYSTIDPPFDQLAWLPTDELFRKSSVAIGRAGAYRQPVIRRLRVPALLLLAVLGLGMRTAAHHSITATYDVERMVTFEAEIVQVVLRNPHSFVHVAVRQPGKAEMRYSIEWTASKRLGGQGVTGTTLKAGDRVIITGQPGREPGDLQLRMTMLRRPKDGFVWVSRQDAMD
jgi:hypothetical protein